MKVSVIFDMDGVLIDSEPLWWQAGVEVLSSVGVAIDNSWSHETKGMRTDEALQYWYRKFPWSGKTIGELTRDIDARVIEIIAACPEPQLLYRMDEITLQGSSISAMHVSQL